MIKKIKILLLTLFSMSLLAACTTAPKPEGRYFVMQPYLQNVHKNGITIMLESYKEDTVFVEYGKGTELNKTGKTTFYRETDGSPYGSYVHRILLEGLEPGSKYNYRVYQENDTSEVYSFVTAVGEGNPFRFATLGDSRSQPEIFSGIISSAAKHNPVFSVYTGDLCYNETYDSWKEEFFIKTHLDYISNVPFFNAVGNHEEWAENTIAFQENSGDPSTPVAWYSFDYGDAHFLILSNEHSLDEDSPQYKFAEDDLKNTDKKWKIVAFHKPAYCGGGHDEDDEMINVTKKILEPNGVDLVLTGHSHFYQKNLVNGIYHMVLAGGGAPLYDPEDREYTLKSVKSHHYAIFDVTSDEIIMNVYGTDGEIIDTLKLTKNDVN